MDNRDETEVRLTMKEHRRLEVLRRVQGRELTAAQGGGLLELSVRQVRRLTKRVREQGARGVIHRNRGRPSNRRLPPEVVRSVQELYRESYDGFNLTHFREMLGEREKVAAPSREAIRKILLGAGLWERRRKAPKHRQRRPRRERAGELLQVDASLHRWFGEEGPVVALVGGVDDATGEVPFAEFFEAETTWAYLRVLGQTIRRRGVPGAIYSDRDSVFVVNNPREREEARWRGKKAQTQFGRALSELGIRWIPAYSPQAKGRIERLWGTFQDRLFNELRVEGIRSIPEANEYLQQKFLPRFNRQFRQRPAEPESAYRPAPASRVLEGILCLKESRSLARDYTFSYRRKLWQVRPTAGVIVLAGRRIEVRETRRGNLEAWLNDRRLNLREAPPTPPRLSAAASGQGRRRPVVRRLATAGLTLRGPRSPAHGSNGGAHPWRKLGIFARRVPLLLGQKR